MGKLRCICENVLSDNDHLGGELFSERQSNTYRDGFGMEYFEQGLGREVMECEECGALAIETDSGSNVFIYYKPDNEKYNKILHNLK